METIRSHTFAPPSLHGLGLFCLVLALAHGGCGSKQKTATQTAGTTAGSTMAWGMGNIDRSRCTASGKEVVTADVNRDNKPDIWKMYEKSGSTQVLSCRQVDLNRDGKVDIVEHYNAGGEIAMVEFDFDFDGKFDQSEFRAQGKVVRKERDLDFDGRPDHMEFYEGGKLVRIELDTNGDGRVNEWQYYEDGKLDRIGYDTTGSGKADKFDRAADETAAAPAAAATP